MDKELYIMNTVIDINTIAKPDMLFETWTEHNGSKEADTREPIVISASLTSQEVLHVATITPIWDQHAIIVLHNDTQTYIDITVDIDYSLMISIVNHIFVTSAEDENYIAQYDSHYRARIHSKVRRFKDAMEQAQRF